jgi:hypothetical protein
MSEQDTEQNTQAKPSLSELKEYYRLHTQQRKEQLGIQNQEQDISQLKSPSANVRPTDSQGRQMSYSDLKAEFDRRRGVSKQDWQTPDLTEKDISAMPKPSEGRSKDQKGSYISYESARQRFYELMGRKDPLVSKKLMDSKNQARRSQYE